MKIVLLLTGELGVNILSFLSERKEEIEGVITLKDQDYFFNEKIKSICSQSSLNYIEVDKNEDISPILIKIEPEIVLSVYWPNILNKEVIDIPEIGIINFHLSFIPFNRGSNPNVWPIIDGTPAGVTLHFIDEDIDSGHIVCQRQVEVSITDTAGTLYKKLISEMTEMFKSEWPKIKDREFKLNKPDLDQGSIHYRNQFKTLEEINLDEEILPLNLINHLRAKTFEGKNGAYFIHEGKKIYVTINLEAESL